MGEPAPLLRAGLYWPDTPLPSLADIAAEWRGDGDTVPIVFYRALVQSGNTAPVDALVAALGARRLRPLPIFVHSLKDGEATALIGECFDAHPPAVILNTTGFSVAASGSDDPLRADCPVLQVVFSGGDEDSWCASTQGLGPRDLAMNVALPEIDGRILTRAVSFKAPLGRDPETEADLVGYRPVADRIAFVAELARNWARLKAKPPAERRVAIVLANYPNRDGRIGNGVGLDTPASAVAILEALNAAGYRVTDMPHDGAALMERLLAGPTNARPQAPAEERLQLSAYSAVFATLPRSVQQRVAAQWGSAERDPFFHPSRLDCGHFGIPGFRCGNIAVLIQPARGYNIDPKATYHDPALVPPHAYLAFYAWLADEFRADAVIDLGKHGNLEWLPGKALALSAECFPEAALGPLPHLYPFIVNDPGEGTQAKRRAQAVIVDHLTPPLTRADSYGEPAELERLIDEYYDAARGDPRRIAPLAAEILERARAAGIDRDCGIAPSDERQRCFEETRRVLCELKEMQIRDGLHVFGTSPERELLDSLLLAIARARRGSEPRDASLLRALAGDLDLGIDPLTAELAEPWTGPRPAVLNSIVMAGLVPAIRMDPRTSPGMTGDENGAPPATRSSDSKRWRCGWSPARRCRSRAGSKTAAVLDWIAQALRPAVAACGDARDRRPSRRPRRALRRTRAVGRADPRPARGAADRAQFLFARHPRGADAGGVAARLEIGRAAGRAPRAGARRLSGAHRALGLGHRQYAHRRRRHRPGAGADGRAPGLGAGAAAASPASRSCRRACSTGRGST